MILVFDLDDTLYDEMTYVKSGFRSVAHFLDASFNIPEAKAYKIMMKELAQNGRGRVFNAVLDK